MRSEGFLFLEAAILGTILVAMTGLLALPRHAAEIRRMDSCRMTAIFLAEEELDVLERRAEDGSLSAGTYGWLGPAEDLSGRPADYHVSGVVQKDGERGFSLTVELHWQENGTSKELRFERWAAHHDRE